MKKSTIFITVMVAFLTLVFMNHNLRGQSLLIENKTGKFAFYDDGKLITPSADYSKLFISFYEKPDADAIILLLSKTEGDLLQPLSEEIVINSKKAMTFYVNQERITSINECQILIGKIKLLPDVASVYPLLIKDNDYAGVENIMIFNITNGDMNDEGSNELIRQVEGKLLEVIDLVKSKSYVIRLKAGSDVFEQSRFLSLNKGINYAQPNFIFKGQTGHTPNDPYYPDQWFLNQVSDADIDAQEAWDVTTGSYNVIVAVIDGNGYDLTHAELSGKLVDPYCAVNDNNDPSATHPEENHGTPCAGLIGAITNNNYGVASVGYNCKVLPIRIGYDFDGGGFSTDSWTIQRAGEHIANTSYSVVAVSNSFGLHSWANIAMVRDAYETMRTQPRGGLGAVVLASTGNGDQMNAVQYPLLFAHVVGVGASNSSDNRADFSNYGDSTDIVAPGVDCYTLDREGVPGYVDGDFYSFGGTSAACPVAAGVVALIGSVHPSWSEHQIKTQLYNSCEKVGEYSYSNNPDYPYSTWNYEMGYGRVNAYLAVQGGSTLQPPTDLQASVSGSNVHISWTAPVGGTEELIYDNNTLTGGYKYIGYTMATRMSPSGPCKVLTIKYYTSTEGSSITFNARVFGWAGSQPGTTPVYERICTGVDEDWFVLDISAFNITFSGDFVIGFGSISEDVYLGYDENLNNGRSWDLYEAGSTWTTWHEAYLIRAVVEYSDGSREELNFNTMPELISLTNGTNNTVRIQKSIVNTILPIEYQANKLRGLLGYNIYRDGNKINSSVVTNTYYDDNGLPNGTYNYNVTAVYNEGESNAAGPVQATVSGGSLLPPGNLAATNNNEKVSLYWIPASGSGWIYYHDNGFENSFASTNGGAGIAQLFTLPTYPVTLKEVRFYTSNHGNYSAPMEVYILSGNGSNVLQGPYTTNGVSNNWITWNVNDISINEPSFMVATYNTNADGPYVGVDESSYNGTLYFGNHTGGFTEMGTWEYYYMGGHEALISTTKDGVIVNEYIKPDTYNPVNKSVILESGKPNRRVTKKAKDTKGFSYYKIYRNGTLLGNSAIPYYGDILPGFGNYNYYVTAYYDEGESVPSNTVTVNWNVGIEENTADQISIYPNPATDIIFVDAIETVTDLQMLNNRGQIIINRNVGSKKFSLDVSQLTTGIYLLYFKTNTGTFVKRIVVE
ncbi:MAG: S8 family serine peptidase [Bacteroidales bacterium]|nr:S8 family serine peptidase [Bacteroidales bacterium]